MLAQMNALKQYLDLKTRVLSFFRISIKDPVCLIFVPLLFWRFYEESWQADWIEKWGFVVLGAGLYLIFTIPFAKIQKAFLSFYLVIASASTYYGFFHKPPTVNLPLIPPDLRSVIENIIYRFNSPVPESAAHLLAFFAFLIFVKMKLDLKKYLEIVGWFLFFCVVVTPSRTLDVPFIHNPTMAATFIILTIRNPVSILAAVLTHSYTGAAVWCVFGLWELRRYFDIVYLFIAAISAFAAIEAFNFWEKIPSNLRFWVWSNYLEWFSGLSVWQILFGAGPGMTANWLPFFSLTHPFGKIAHVYIWAHNDWLQSLIEIGVIPFGFGLLALRKLFSMAQESDQGLILGISAAMVTNPVMHFPIAALIGFSLVSRNINKKENF